MKVLICLIGVQRLLEETLREAWVEPSGRRVEPHLQRLPQATVRQLPGLGVPAVRPGGREHAESHMPDVQGEAWRAGADRELGAGGHGRAGAGGPRRAVFVKRMGGGTPR